MTLEASTAIRTGVLKVKLFRSLKSSTLGSHSDMDLATGPATSPGVAPGQPCSV